MRLINSLRLRLLAKANAVMASRPPDLVINGSTQRWMVRPRNKWWNVYIHYWVADDVDQVLHDHAPDNLSVILSGWCLEHFHVKPLQRELVGGVVQHRTYSVVRQPGDLVFRLAHTPHKITLFDSLDPAGPKKPMVTMFVQGPRRREWGFSCPNGWRPWQEYIDVAKGYGDRSGKGCD